MDFLELIKEARTCRRFVESSPLPENTLEWLVDCARVVSSTRNQQLLRFVAVESPENRARVFPALRWAGQLADWDGPVPGERPTGYLIMCAPADAGPTVRIDMGLAGEAIQLAATSRGLAACMLMSFDARLVAAELALQKDLPPVLVIAVGKPLETRRLAEVPASGSLNYWRDEHGVHYVPKINMDTILLKKM